MQGGAVSTLGDLMYSVAIGYWVYQQTGSNSLMGIMSSISMFVTMFLSPFAGSIIDKCNRKWVLVGVDLIQSAVMITVGVLAFMDKLNVAGVLIAAFLAALGSVLYSPASSTLLIDLIPRDDMVRGQSIYSATFSTINMVGTAISGVVVAFFGVPLIVVINGLSNLYSAASEMFISVPRTAQQGNPVTIKTVLGDSGKAIKEIISDPCLRIFCPMAMILNLLVAGAFTLILPFCLEKGFGVDHYGYIGAVFTAGNLICVLILGVIKFSPKARYLIMTIGFCSEVVFMILAFLSTKFLPMCIFAFLAAFLNCAGNAIFNASMMLALPEENRGAILGFVQAACTGGSALSAVIYGVLGDIFPLYIVFSVGSLISLFPMLYLCLHPRIKAFVLSH